MEELSNRTLQVRTNSTGECFVFMIGVWEFAPEENGADENLPHFRKMFEANAVDRRERFREKCNIIRIAVHIRRGDLLSFLNMKRSSYRINTTQNRLVHENVYVDLLKQLIHKLDGLGLHKIEIRLFCEDMVAPSKIPSAIDWELIDMHEQLLSNINISQDIAILPGSNNSIEAFEEMCFSDVMITGASGFSHMASILCKTPVVLGIPFWLSYDYVPNALVSFYSVTTIPMCQFRIF